MSDNSVRLQITLRRSIPAEKAILDMLDGAGTGIARQHLLRDLLTRAVQAAATPAQVAAPVVVAPARPAPSKASEVMPAAPAIPQTGKSKRPLADLM